MQTLYGLEEKQEIGMAAAQKSLAQKIELSRELYTYLIYFITQVARYAETDARKKAGKHLPTVMDLAVNTRLAGNELLWKIIENPQFCSAEREFKPDQKIDRDLLKKIYQQLIVTPEYAEYIQEQGRDKKTEKNIFEFIFNNLLLPNEDFISHIEELFINWDDDAEMMQLLVQNFLNKPVMTGFLEILSPEKKQFAKDLLSTVVNKSSYTLELIKPKLKNWDADRIAALDLIILQMGVCEFLYFETIPTKVTINEYIDLAKEYSTAQSGHFVNGLLDNIHKDLQSENKIDKKKFKNSVL